jgi:hypothetical protein
VLILQLIGAIENGINVCGHIEFDDISDTTVRNISVYKEIGISPLLNFDDIYKQFTNKTLIRVVNNNCFIVICGHPTKFKQGQRGAIIPSCTRFNSNFSQEFLSSDPFQVFNKKNIHCD